MYACYAYDVLLVCMWVHAFKGMFVCIHACVCVCMHKYIHTYTYIGCFLETKWEGARFVSVYKYLYTYAHTYINTYIPYIGDTQNKVIHIHVFMQTKM